MVLKFLKKWFSGLFGKKKNIKIGIYGPPNAGKCLTPDTEIVLHNGEIKNIKQLFDEVREAKSHFSKVSRFDGFEESYIDTSDLNIMVPSLDTKTLKIIPKKLSFVYAQNYKGLLIEITTKCGRTIKGTPEHPIIKLSHEGTSFVKLCELNLGEYVSIAPNLSFSENLAINKIKNTDVNRNGNIIQSIRKFHSSTEDINFNSVFGLLENSDCRLDEIKEIKIKDYDDYVYDITVDDTHTFLLSNGLVSGNSTLANRITKDWLGEEMSKVSPIPHETREIIVKEKITVKSKGKELTFNLVDTPGIATKIDYEDFLKFKMNNKEAKDRAKEATKGVIESIKWLDSMDCVLVVLDSTQNPYSQVNITIIGNLAARNIPVMVVANKTDLRRSDVKRVEAAFPQYITIGISADKGHNIEEFYDELFRLVK